MKYKISYSVAKSMISDLEREEITRTLERMEREYDLKKNENLERLRARLLEIRRKELTGKEAV